MCADAEEDRDYLNVEPLHFQSELEFFFIVSHRKLCCICTEDLHSPCASYVPVHSNFAEHLFTA